MTLYNVRTSVVGLIEADSPEQAIQYLHLALADDGYEVYEPAGSDVFESEEINE